MSVKNLRIIWKEIIKKNYLKEIVIGHVVALIEMILDEIEVEMGVTEVAEVGYLEAGEEEDSEVEDEAEALWGFLPRGMSVDLDLQETE